MMRSFGLSSPLGPACRVAFSVSDAPEKAAVGLDPWQSMFPERRRWLQPIYGWNLGKIHSLLRPRCWWLVCIEHRERVQRSTVRVLVPINARPIM